MNLKPLLKYNLDFKIVIVAVLYYLAARFGYFLAFENASSLPTWPPSGLGFALIILLGRKAWPGITIGALLASIMAMKANAPDLSAQNVISISSFMAIGNTLEAVLGNFLLKRWVRDDFPFHHTKNTFRFLFITMVIAIVASTIATFSLWVNDRISAGYFMTALFRWWVGNVVGILLFTPFILSLFRKHKFSFHTDKILEIVIFAVLAVGLYLLLQVEELSFTMSRALPYLLIPFLLWLAFRFQLIISISAVVIVSVVTIYLTANNTGPFVLETASSTMLLLQIFVSVISISTIILAATVKERTEVQNKLVKFNENLEDMVKARTKELNDQIETRKKAEDKLKNTNEELSKRNVELDNFVYSVSHDLRAPIASVLGIINLAKRDEDRNMKDAYLDMINKSALQQDNFIKEILDQSRNSRLEVKREEISFKSIIDETFNQLKHATSDGEKVEKSINIKQDQPFYCDAWRIKVILNNVFSNAIRYRNGRDPVIKVNVSIKDHAAKLVIEDNGRGISKEHIDKVYDMFYRATDDGAGSGLGLYIVKETVDKLKGKINIESEEGKGTKVSFEIPEVETA
ncbi:MASE1 domain-containing protein [Fulvivirga sp.]|uniref:sensor histidine kinase n=1 Tax=Fulvivirga sp. TaxID=1931237 RepID=UPI0032EF1FB0